jgi:hypothetical protein
LNSPFSPPMSAQCLSISARSFYYFIFCKAP